MKYFDVMYAFSYLCFDHFEEIINFLHFFILVLLLLLVALCRILLLLRVSFLPERVPGVPGVPGVPTGVPTEVPPLPAAWVQARGLDTQDTAQQAGRK